MYWLAERQHLEDHDLSNVACFVRVLEEDGMTTESGLATWLN